MASNTIIPVRPARMCARWLAARPEQPVLMRNVQRNIAALAQINANWPAVRKGLSASKKLAAKNIVPSVVPLDT